MYLFCYLILIIITFPLLLFCSKKVIISKNPLWVVHVWSTFIFTIIGSVFVFFPEINKSSKKVYYTDDFFYIQLVVIILLYIFSLLAFTFNHKKILLKKSCSKKINKKIFISLLLFFSFIIIIFDIIFNSIPPILTFINNASDFNISDIVSHRSDSFENYNYIWVSQIGYYTFPLFSCLLLINYKNKNYFFRITRFVIVSISVFLSLSFMHKTPLVYFISSAAIFILFMDIKRFNFKNLFYTSAVLFSSICLLYYLFMFNYEISYIYSMLPLEILNRVIGSYSMSLSVAVSYVNAHDNSLFTAISINPLGIFPEMINLSKKIHFEIFGFSGNAPCSWIGYSYANIGYLGIVLYSFLIFFFITFINYFLNTLTSHTVKILILTYFSIRIITLSHSSFEDALFNPTIILTFVLFFTIYYFTKHFFEIFFKNTY